MSRKKIAGGSYGKTNFADRAEATRAALAGKTVESVDAQSDGFGQVCAIDLKLTDGTIVVVYLRETGVPSPCIESVLYQDPPESGRHRKGH
jgi:hypothetical protein